VGRHEVPAADQEHRDDRRDEGADAGHDQDLVQPGHERRPDGVPGDLAVGRRRGAERPLALPLADGRGQRVRVAGQRGCAQPADDVAREPGGEQRAVNGDPGGDPDLAERGVDARCHARRAVRDDADGCRGQRRVDQARAQAGQDHPGDQVSPAGADRQPGHQQQAGAGHGQARPDQQPHGNAAAQPA
jgi:hypothetical protein